MYEQFVKCFGPEEAFKICRTCLERPRLTIRANTLKTTRQELMTTLTKEYDYEVQPCKYSPNGIRFKKRPEDSLFAHVEYKKGHFEIQDEASQLLAMRVDARPGQTVLDYCGGSGGKTLAFAPFMHNTGQIYVHDIRKSVLMQARQRFKRAGVQNYQIQADKAKLRKRLKGRCDWILLDVPCSGSGVIRRNPDIKWKYQPERLQELIRIQELILQDSINFLRDDRSRIVYSTCSLFDEENLH